MAEFSKYNGYAVGRLLMHNNRSSDDGVKHSNESIDLERTVYNYFLKKGTAEDVKKRIEEIFVVKKSNTTILGEMIVTLPRDVEEEDERKFFQAVYDFYSADFGEENIINAVVHKDEKQAHIHLDFIPVVKGEPEFKKNDRTSCGVKQLKEWIEKKGETPQERICMREKINRNYLQKMHPRLSKHIEDVLGYETQIINGATVNGNRTVLQLKEETLKKEIEEMEKKKLYLKQDIGEILNLAKKNKIEEGDIGMYPLLQKIADLENQNEILKNIITREDYKFKKEDLEKIKEKKYIPARSAAVNVYDGSLVDAEIENDAVLIIELPNEISRPLPQRRLIERDMDLERQTNFAISSTQQVMCRQSRTSDRIYLFVKTDNSRQTIDNLLLMERQLREIDEKKRKVYMDKFSTDEYDLAKTILMKNQINASYFTGEEKESKERQNEKTKEI